MASLSQIWSHAHLSAFGLGLWGILKPIWNINSIFINIQGRYMNRARILFQINTWGCLDHHNLEVVKHTALVYTQRFFDLSSPELNYLGKWAWGYLYRRSRTIHIWQPESIQTQYIKTPQGSIQEHRHSLRKRRGHLHPRGKSTSSAPTFQWSNSDSILILSSFIPTE